MKPLKQWLEDPKFRKRLKKTVVALLLTLSVLGAAGVFVGFFYEDAVKRIIINELNKRLNTEIAVQDIENDIQFSIFRKFPYASVSFSNVKVMDAIKTQKPKGVLLEASSLSLQFSILDMLFGRYKIKKIEAEEGNINIKIYKNRSDNYHFWKPSADTSASDFALDLQKIVLDDMGLSYVDYGRKQDYKVFARNVVLKGKFADNEYTLKIEGRVFVYLIKLEQDIYLANQPADLDVTLYVNSGNDYVTFKKGGIDIGKLGFDITGTINYAESNTLLDLRVEGKKMKIQSLINQLPSRYRGWLGYYEFKGDFNFIALVKGYTGEKTNPLVSVSFGLKDGEIIQKQNSINLSHVSFDAEITNGSSHQKATTALSVRNFKSQLNDGNITGSIRIKNFNNPEIALKLSASLDLKDIFLFVKTDTVQAASGKIILNTEINGIIERPDGFTVKDFIASTSTGTLEVRDAGIELKGGRHNFSGLNGIFTFSNNDIETGQFGGKYMATDFTMRGKFKNIIPYLFIENQSLLIDAGFHSDFIDLGEILEYSSGKKDTVYRMEMPENVDFSLVLDIGKLIFKKFSATNITGKVTMKDKQFVAHDISLKAMNGSILFSGLVDGAAPDKLLISCDASIKKVDIKRLFGELENFGQTSLQERNLKGQLSATLQFASVWSSTFKVEKPTIYAKADIAIENGALIDYEPLSGLSKYLKGRDLKNVSFETMKNTIEIKNEVIQIPKMEINSNAIDFQVNGTHGFDQKIDYHLSVLLSELGTVKEKNMQAEDIGVIADDGLHKERYFFRITGTVDEPVYHTIDKEGYKANIKTNLAKEKESLKEILNREFGWFKKDTTITKEKGQKAKEKYEFNVVWDEDE
ncbi:MAG TPA: AsmA-like C-terminal region-containing protein, partial [Bacteroidales bacterium]|nr:AsmA-like C-terminal region-containing protein [Bacteroidales bacterium]